MRSRTGFVRLFVAGVAIALLAVSCGNKQDSGGGSGSGSGNGGTGSAGTAAGGGSAFSISTDKCDNPSAATEVLSGNEIKIGSSYPQSGLYAAFAEIAKGWQASFKAQNSAGGINGKQLTAVTKDDSYDPAKTKANIAEMIDKDKVFSLFSVVGTPNNLQIRGQLNKDCVPDLYTATGSQLMGNPAKYPWVIGFLPAYATEGAVFASYLKANKNTAKVGILRQNDDFGDGYLDSFKKGIEGTGITIVGTETYEPGGADVTSQITKLNGSGADTLLLATTALACPNAINAAGAIAGWKPLMYVSGTCASKFLMGPTGDAGKGVLSSVYLKQPLDPQWANDPAMMKYKAAMQAAGLSQDDIDNAIDAYGYTAGELMVQTLQKTPQLSRQSVMQTAYNLKGLTPGLVLPGITVNTNGTADPYPIEQLQMGSWNGNYFAAQGDMITYEGKTSTVVDQSKGQD